MTATHTTRAWRLICEAHREASRQPARPETIWPAPPYHAIHWPASARQQRLEALARRADAKAARHV